jgi:hypothetical protein
VLLFGVVAAFSDKSLSNVAFVEYVLLRSMYMSSVRVWCSCLLVICKQITNRQEHQIIMQTQRMQISGRNSNGTKHSGRPPEDGREKRPKRVGVLYKHVFNILLFLNVEVSVF